jgi:hypothetical protein
MDKVVFALSRLRSSYSTAAHENTMEVPKPSRDDKAEFWLCCALEPFALFIFPQLDSGGDNLGS